MKGLYKYPQSAFPYERLVREAHQRDRRQPEFELLDTGVFDGDRYFDVQVEYAKASPDDILVRISVFNRGPEAATLDLLPTLWFRNTWSWDGSDRPVLRAGSSGGDVAVVEAEHGSLGPRWLYCDGSPELLFTENETNAERLYGLANPTPYVKDGIDAYVVHARREAVNPSRTGTKVAARYSLTIGPGQQASVRLRLSDTPLPGGAFGGGFERAFQERQCEADDFYATVIPGTCPTTRAW